MTTIINQRPRKVSEDNFGIHSAAISDTENDDMFVRVQQNSDSFDQQVNNSYVMNKLETGKLHDVAAIQHSEIVRVHEKLDHILDFALREIRILRLILLYFMQAVQRPSQQLKAVTRIRLGARLARS